MIQLLSQRSLFLLRNYFHYCRLPAGTDFDWQKENSEEFGVGVLLSGKVASIRREDSIKTVFQMKYSDPACWSETMASCANFVRAARLQPGKQ